MARVNTASVYEETLDVPIRMISDPLCTSKPLHRWSTSDLASELLRRKRIKWMHVSRPFDECDLTNMGSWRGAFLRDAKFRMAHELASKLLEDGVFQERQERGLCSDALILGLSLPIFIRHDDGTVK